MITFEDVKNRKEINTYIERGNDVLGVLGYTEHSFAHAGRVAEIGAYILERLEFSKREIELVKISAWMHDIGNVVNRENHAQSGAVMAFRILDRMGISADELATIVGAIGNHDESSGSAVSPVSAALILADKCDVRRTRVRNQDMIRFDIHDRVNYAVEKSTLTLDLESREITLMLDIDTKICPVMDYFEIFLSRMLMCRRAAEYLELKFALLMNGSKLL